MVLCVLILGTNIRAIAADTVRTTLSGHVPAVVSRLAAKSRLSATNQLSLGIGLPLRNRAELEALLVELYRPGTTNYHKFLAPADFASRFGPTEEDYQRVIAFARANHLRVTQTFPITWCWG